MLPRHHQRVPGRRRVDVHEGDRALVGVDRLARDRARRRCRRRGSHPPCGGRLAYPQIQAARRQGRRAAGTWMPSCISYAAGRSRSERCRPLNVRQSEGYDPSWSSCPSSCCRPCASAGRRSRAARRWSSADSCPSASAASLRTSRSPWSSRSRQGRDGRAVHIGEVDRPVLLAAAVARDASARVTLAVVARSWWASRSPSLSRLPACALHA